MTEYLYIKQDSDLQKALEIAQSVSYARIENGGCGRVIATNNYDDVAYKLAVEDIYFTRYQ